MLLDILFNETIVVPLISNEKKAVIEELVDKLNENNKISNRNQVLQAILDREDVMSTGVGDGVAIPHGKSDAVHEIVAALGITREPVEFASIDEKPVRIVWLLVGPPGQTGPHLKALSRISRLMHNGEFREQLIHSENQEQVLACIQEEEKKCFDN